MLFANGKIEEAAREYKSIFTEDPTRVSAEEKFAKATLQIAEGVRQQNLLEGNGGESEQAVCRL